MVKQIMKMSYYYCQNYFTPNNTAVASRTISCLEISGFLLFYESLFPPIYERCYIKHGAFVLELPPVRLIIRLR